MTQKRAKLSWYKRDPSKFFAGTVGMGWEQKAIYSVVLDLIFDAGGKLPDDGPRITHYLGVGMSLQRWHRTRQELLDRGKLRLVDGFLTNDRMTRDLLEGGGTPSPTPPTTPQQTPEKNHKKNPEENSDLFSASASSNKDLTSLADAQSAPFPARARESQSQSQRESATRAEVIVAVEEIAKALNQDRGRYWENDYRKLLEDGLEYADILEAARMHKSGHIKGLYRLAGLARSLRDARLEGRAPQSKVTAPPAPKELQAEGMTAKQWEQSLALLCRLGSWDEAALGPPPTREGHMVPKALYAMWLPIWKLQGEHPHQEIDHGGNIVDYPAERPSEYARAMWAPGKGEVSNNPMHPRR